MLRLLALMLLSSSSIALAQAPPAPPAPALPAASLELPAGAEVAPEEPKMRKVCRQVEVVGSSIGRTECSMKPARAPKPPPKAD